MKKVENMSRTSHERNDVELLLLFFLLSEIYCWMNSISFRGSESVKWFHEVQNVINEKELEI